MGCCQHIRGYQNDDVITVGEQTRNGVKRHTFVKKRCATRMQDYEILEKIGKGAFGTVFKARDLLTGQLRAIKSIEKQRMHLGKIYQEIEILKHLDHPNIVQIFEFIEEEETFYIVMELCTGANLFQKVVEMPKFSEKHAALYVSQILSATVHCHERGIIHRDIKPENILFESNCEGSLIKIIDFGLASRLVKDDKLSDLSGTPYFIAPEVIQRRYDEKSDLWSIGVVLYILLSGKVPFAGGNTKSLFQKVLCSSLIFKPQDWTDISSEAKIFIKSLLRKNPECRISAAEALAHPWLKSQISKDIKKHSLNTEILQRLKFFQTTQRLRQTVLAYISSHLSEAYDQKLLREQFIAVDKNNDGKLSRQELISAYKQLKLGGEKEVIQIMSMCDIDCDGYIDYSEFIIASTNWEKELTVQNLMATFKELDVSQSGMISDDDFKKFIGEDGKIGVEFINEMIKEADRNGDGMVDLDEFIGFMLEK